MIKNLLNPVRFSLCQMSKASTNTLLCLFVLAGCIALVSSMFRLSYMAFLWKAPFENSDRIVSMVRVGEKETGEKTQWSFRSIETLESGSSDLFSAVIPVYGDGDTFKHGESRSIGGYSYVRWDFLSLLGVRPMMGRAFAADDAKADAAPVAIISESLWKRLFNEDPNVIGSTITLMGRERTVVGVMPDSFAFPVSIERPRSVVWMPFNAVAVHNETGYANEAMLYGVLKPGVSMSAAERRFQDVTQRVVESLPGDNAGIMGGRLRRLDGGYIPENIKQLVLATGACSVLLLIMGCCIVSGLLSARYAARTQELAIRSALGATRGRIVGGMLVEFAFLSVVSVILGIFLERWFERATMAEYMELMMIPDFVRNVSSGWMVFFTASVLCLATLFSSLLPALRASRPDVATVLHDSSRTGSSFRITRMSNFVIVSQVAIACVVLCGGAMIACKIADLHDDEAYFNPDEYLCSQFLFDPKDFKSGAEKTRICLNILDELKKNPEVEKVGITTEVYGRSGGGTQWGSNVRTLIEGESYPNDNDIPSVLMRLVSPGYFASLNIPIIAGRDFTLSDNAEHQQVAAVTDAFAKRYFGTTDAIGKRFRLWSPNGALITVIAIVPDVYNKHGGDGKTGVFIPYACMPWDGIVIYMKGHGDPNGYSRFLAETIQKVDSRLVVFRTVTMRKMRDEQGLGMMLNLVFTYFSLFAAGALVLVAGGLYGVISLSFGLRKAELGIRMALGADPFGLVGLFAKRGVTYVLAGMIPGILGSVLLRHQLVGAFGGQLADTWQAYAAVAGILLGASALAIFIPASRCAYIDPSKVLRDE